MIAVVTVTALVAVWLLRLLLRLGLRLLALLLRLRLRPLLLLLLLLWRPAAVLHVVLAGVRVVVIPKLRRRIVLRWSVVAVPRILVLRCVARLLAVARLRSIVAVPRILVLRLR